MIKNYAINPTTTILKLVYTIINHYKSRFSGGNLFFYSALEFTAHD